jgi:hypothetical protein
MRQFISAIFLLASAAHAVEANMSSSNVDSGSQGICKVAVSKVGESMSDGNYQGQCLNGKPNGIGEVVFANGDRFSGMFKNGRIEGSGSWTSGSSGNTYSGNWKNGRRDGAGTYSWAQSSQQYVGEWADDKRHGKGTLTWRNGDRFEGEFRNNQQYTGTYFTAGGATHTCYMGSCR